MGQQGIKDRATGQGAHIKRMRLGGVGQRMARLKALLRATRAS